LQELDKVSRRLSGGPEPVGPVFELFTAAPWIHYYDDWFFASSQGVFGFVNQLRIEMVMEVKTQVQNKGQVIAAKNTTQDSEISKQDSENSKQIDTWRPLDFNCLPGSLDRRPCFLSPYHSRLDWQTWIITTASLEHQIEAIHEQRGGKRSGNRNVDLSEVFKGGFGDEDSSV
jgi:hypothetical protein